MPEAHHTSAPAPPPVKPEPKRASRFGNPASEARALIPVLVFTIISALGFLLVVMIPISVTVSKEPNLFIQAVLADFRLMLNLRFWPVLLGAAVLAGGAAVMIARRIQRGHNLLEKRLRRLASGEMDEAPFSPSEEFPQFQEVLLTLHYAQEQARKKGRNTLLQAESTIDKLARRLANEDVPILEVRRSLSGIQAELNALLEATRPLGSGKPK